MSKRALLVQTPTRPGLTSEEISNTVLGLSVFQVNAGSELLVASEVGLGYFICGDIF